MTTPTDTAATLSRLATAAAERFGGWDWTHDPAGEVVDGPGPQEDWDTWERERAQDVGAAAAAAEREYGESAQGCAEAAADLAAQCVAAAERGDWSEALRCAERARDIEAEYGDAPAYQPLVDAIREAR